MGDGRGNALAVGVRVRGSSLLALAVLAFCPALRRSDRETSGVSSGLAHMEHISESDKRSLTIVRPVDAVPVQPIVRWLRRLFGRRRKTTRAFCAAAKATSPGPLAHARKQLCNRLGRRSRSSLPVHSSVHQQQLQLKPWHRLFSQAGQPGDGAPDFFLFIKDYGWALRYGVRWMKEQVLNTEQPLQLEWIKLRRTVRDPETLLAASSEDLLDWSDVRAANYNGFKYQVKRVLDSGVEAVINFLEDKGVSLLIRPDDGIQIVNKAEPGRRFTHCWVDVMGMPLLPVVKSVSFFDLEQVVLHWQG
eukprot:CAMPEP_0115059680 /NCGR_PEP_ID=MMETSP0227-20121206/7052_1 /TAXON_ID=89957 /ORGANISM="Polarella glacialis, Strain CCMP 1383" /LENGTH=303 /DNA_ID=CAMNT_0002444829 /DNA_START=107 /DNA_END=1018 /DNA_ORIENTATION=+